MIIGDDRNNNEDEDDIESYDSNPALFSDDEYDVDAKQKNPL